MSRAVPAEVTELVHQARESTTCPRCAGHRRGCVGCRGSGRPDGDLEAQILVERLSRALLDAYGLP